MADIIARVTYNFIPEKDANLSPWGDYYQIGMPFQDPFGIPIICQKILEDKREGRPCVKIHFDNGSMIKQYNINQIFWVPNIPEEDEQTGQTDNDDEFDQRV